MSNSSLLINSAVEVAAVFDLNDYGFGFVDSNIICPLQPEINKNALKFFSDSSPDKAWEANKTAIKTKPIIVLTDVYHLKFRNEYLKQHGAHFIILFYYDELSNSVGVLDWYEPHFYKGEILLNDFLSARYNFSNNPFSGYYINNNWCELDTRHCSLDPEICLYNNIRNSLHPPKYLLNVYKQ